MIGYIRRGECRRCGACCLGAGWFGMIAGPHLLEWLRVRDPEIRILPPDAEEGQAISVKIPHRCVHLVGEQPGEYGCDLHEDDKPAMCRAYPVGPRYLPETCGFYFEEVEL